MKVKYLKQKHWAWILLAPMCCVLVLVAFYPLLRTFLLSFTNSTIFAADDETRFIGLKNYFNVLTDPDWWVSVRNTLLFTMLSVVLETGFGLAVALALNSKFKARGLMRATVLVPWAIPTVVSARMWSWMYNDLYGVMNDLLLKSGFVTERVAWLVQDHLILLSVVIVDVWKTTPFMALLLLAGLQNIPKDVYEAASIDTPSKIRIFFRITLPLLKPALVVAVIFRALDALRIFDLVYVLTNNKASTSTMAVYARQQMIDFQEFGYGSAASVLIFAFIAVITAGYIVVVKPQFAATSKE